MGYREDYGLPPRNPNDDIQEALSLLVDAIGNTPTRADAEPTEVEPDYTGVGVEEYIEYYHNEYHDYRPSRLVVAIANIVSLGRFRDWADDITYYFEQSCRSSLMKDALHVKSKNYAIVKEATQIREEYSALLVEDAKKDAVIAGHAEEVEIKDALIQSLKERIGELEDENRGLRSDNRNLRADANNTRQAVENARAQEEGRKAEKVDNGYRFASIDGIPGKAKKIMIFVGVNIFGWTFDDIGNRFQTKDGPMKESTIIAYYKDAKKKFSNISNNYYSHEHTFCFKDDLAGVQFLAYFSAEERRYINDLIIHSDESPILDYFKPMYNGTYRTDMLTFKRIADYPGAGMDFRPLIDEYYDSNEGVVDDAS